MTVKYYSILYILELDIATRKQTTVDLAALTVMQDACQ